MKRDNKESYELPCERFMKDALAKAAGALEVGERLRFQLLHHAQPPLYFHHAKGQAMMPQGATVVPKLLKGLVWVAHTQLISPSNHAFL
jgi:hypothetical protein